MRTQVFSPLFFPLFLAVLLALGLASTLTAARAAHSGNVIYVDAAASGTNDGSNWADAYTSLQDALAHAAAGDQIWVAAGIYYPDEGAGQTDGDRSASFTLQDDVALYGGFAGVETALSQRDPAVNVTVLSGDIGQDDITDSNGVVTDTANIISDNSFHVVHADSVTTTAVLDGFTITAGNANGSISWSRGGGLDNINGSPTLSNLIFSGNKGVYGGGMWNQGQASQPHLENVTFSNNQATADGGGLFNSGSLATLNNVLFTGNQSNGNGGGVVSNDNSNVTFNNVIFSGNSAGGSGGGMFNNSNDPVLADVAFIGNAAGNGGGMANTNTAAPTVTNVTFSSNQATINGGGVYNSNSQPTFINVTLSGNSASGGGGIYSESGTSLTLINVIVANSSGGDCANNGTASLSSSSSHNLLEDTDANACGLTPGVDGNIIGQNPNLGALTDYGAPGRQVFPLLFGSPAIDAGDDANCPVTDQRGQPRPVGAACDIGAYEADGISRLLYLPLIVKP